MRYYRNFSEALNELKRELKEMGIRVHSKSVQNLDISDDSKYDSLEIQNYQYTVTEPDYSSIPLTNPRWCEEEFHERTGGRPLNPGNAWRLREQYWEQFRKWDGRFDYAYPERMSNILPKVINALAKDPSTRRAFLPIFDRDEDVQDDFKVRIPCSLGYWFYYRQDRLHVTYLQRSADFSEHFNNDVYLADRLKCYIANKLEMKPGTFSHWLGSLHVFMKDVEGVF